ncbi:hypothetical protein R3P38DRAFT_2571564, partial [Favolaschia claudopus]
YANCAARFIFAYSNGLTGGDLIHVKRKFKGHRMLPPAMIAEMKASIAGLPTRMSGDSTAMTSSDLGRSSLSPRHHAVCSLMSYLTSPLVYK